MATTMEWCTVKCALVCGAGGFIGDHLVRRLKREGFRVRGVDLKFNEFSEIEADDSSLATYTSRVFAAR
jgi:GDP-D-mannose 3', 5'-epimerase